MAKGKFSGSSVKRAGGIMAAVESGCQLLARQIRQLESRIAQEERNLANREADLKKLQGQVPPDQKAIKQLTATIAMMQKQLDTDGVTLSRLQEDFSFFCSG
jgi:septal ring factor EnvC (AmiA/AmiB activator)